MNRTRSVISEKYRNINLLTEQEAALIKRQNPWPHFVLDDFIKVDKFKKYQSAVLSKKHKFSIADDDPYLIQFTLLRYIPLARIFYSVEFKNLLETLSNCKLSLNTRIFVQLRRMTKDSPPFSRHMDASTNNIRTFLAVFYLSSWEEGLGGELCMHRDRYEDESKEVVLPPIENRLLLFSSEDTYWHSVRKTNNWDRYTVISEWVIEKQL